MTARMKSYRNSKSQIIELQSRNSLQSRKNTGKLATTPKTIEEDQNPRYQMAGITAELPILRLWEQTTMRMPTRRMGWETLSQTVSSWNHQEESNLRESCRAIRISELALKETIGVARLATLTRRGLWHLQNSEKISNTYSSSREELHKKEALPPNLRTLQQAHKTTDPPWTATTTHTLRDNSKATPACNT